MGQTRIMKLFIYSMFIVFLSYGVFYTATGSLTVPIMEYFHIDTAGRGLMLLLQGIGGFSIALFAMCFGEHVSKVFLFFMGIALISIVGILVTGISLLSAFSALLFFFGMGTVLLDTQGTALISDTFKADQDKYISFLHLFFGIGAIISNIITIFIISNSHATWKNVYFIFALICAASTVLFVTTALMAKKHMPVKKASIANPIREVLSLFKVSQTWKIIIGMFFFSVFLSTVTTWLPYQWEKILGFDKSFSVLAVSFFYLGIIGMRILLPALLKRFSPQQLIFAGSICAGASIVISITAQFAVLSLVFTIIGGFLSGGHYPLFAILSFRVFPEKTSFASSILLLASTISGFITPWVTGEIAKMVNINLAIILSCACLAVCGIIVRATKKPADATIKN